MDPFILAVLIFSVVCVGMFFLVISEGVKPSNGRKQEFTEKQENSNLKYLQEIKRYEFWRDDG